MDGDEIDLGRRGAFEGPFVRVVMLLAYNGSAFHGFADQRNEAVKTVAGELKTVLSQLLGVDVDITCAGRTDAGVHAWGQVITFDIPQSAHARAHTSQMQHVINRRLGPDILIRQAGIVDSSFDARFSATARKYRYSVLNTPLHNPFLTNTTWWIAEEIDIDAMNEARSAIIGEHDFTSFCRKPDEEKSLVRRINSARWHQLEDGIMRFDIEANAFCHQMVRALTGMLVEIGRRKRAIEDMAFVLEAKDRQKAAPLAPPQGLCLWEVVY